MCIYSHESSFLKSSLHTLGMCVGEEMPRKEKKSALEEKLQHLRSVTKSNAANKTSILVDASKYIKELKDKVEEAAAGAQADSSSTTSAGSSAMAAMVSVSSAELELYSSSSSRSRRGFRINVSMERSRPGLLVSVLEAFEELGLDVFDADVSCADDTAAFRLQALGSGQGQQGESVDEQMVRQAVLRAISKCCVDDDDE